MRGVRNYVSCSPSIREMFWEGECVRLRAETKMWKSLARRLSWGCVLLSWVVFALLTTIAVTA